MFYFLWITVVASAIGLASASAYDFATDDVWTLNLLKRQAPGTPLYSCHENCGGAIIASRGSDPCHNTTFITAYEACLQCAGPDRFDIWRFYGATLTAAGTKCGFSTTPASGSASDTSSAAAPSATPLSTSTVAPNTATILPVTTSATGTAAPSSSTVEPQPKPPTITTGNSTSTGTASPTRFTGAAYRATPNALGFLALASLASLLFLDF